MHNRTSIPPDVPELSVVVVSLTGRPRYLRRCLEALQGQVLETAPEIIVPADGRLGDLAGLRADFDDVRFLPVEGESGFPRMRAAGFRAARGRVVALTEDHCLPTVDWCSRTLEAHRGGEQVVGGAVEKVPPSGAADDTTLNWAVYLCDFSRYANPLPEGPSAYLTDCNVSYDREVLEEIRELWEQEFHETTVHWELTRRGYRLHLSPDVVVGQQRSLSPGEALRERRRFGALFASTRVEDTPRWQHFLYAAGCAVLPLVLTLRVARNAWSRPKLRRAFLRSVPLVGLLTLVWTLGEFTTYLAGGRRGSGSAPDPSADVERRAVPEGPSTAARSARRPDE